MTLEEKLRLSFTLEKMEIQYFRVCLNFNVRMTHTHIIIIKIIIKF